MSVNYREAKEPRRESFATPAVWCIWRPPIAAGGRSWDLWQEPVKGQNPYHVSVLGLCLQVQWKWEWGESFSKFRSRRKIFVWTSALATATLEKISSEYSCFLLIQFSPNTAVVCFRLASVSLLMRKKTKEWKRSVCCVPSRLVVSNSLQPHGLSPPGSSVHGDSPGKSTGIVAMLSSRGSSRPRDQARVSCIADGFFTSWAARDRF